LIRVGVGFWCSGSELRRHNNSDDV
jgi:hypothetical protein